MHSTARVGKLTVLQNTILEIDETELHELLAKQNQDGETSLYIVVEYGYIDVGREMIQYYDNIILSLIIRLNNSVTTELIQLHQYSLHYSLYLQSYTQITGLIHFVLNKK